VPSAQVRIMFVFVLKGNEVLTAVSGLWL
jgi:hypothetical protein